MVCLARHSTAFSPLQAAFLKKRASDVVTDFAKAIFCAAGCGMFWIGSNVLSLSVSVLLICGKPFVLKRAVISLICGGPV